MEDLGTVVFILSTYLKVIKGLLISLLWVIRLYPFWKTYLHSADGERRTVILNTVERRRRFELIKRYEEKAQN